MADHFSDNIKQLSCLQKLDQFLKLADFYHVERCENKDCTNCLFVVNLRYLYVQNEVQNDDSVVPLQRFCKIKYGNFHSVRLFLRSLGALERKGVELDREFQRV